MSRAFASSVAGWGAASAASSAAGAAPPERMSNASFQVSHGGFAIDAADLERAELGDVDLEPHGDLAAAARAQHA